MGTRVGRNLAFLSLLLTCAAFVGESTAASKFVPKWKKQACEVPASQNEHSHYRCDDNGEVKCLAGWTGDLCDVPICKKGCDPLQGYCKRPGECRCKLGFYGEHCNKCIALPGCQHGYCNSSFECICYEGWDGLFCSEPICRLDCHSTRGYCEYPGECRCRLGWSGETCKECQVLPGCQHGYCTKPLECKCQEGWTGILCQTPVCASSCHKERGYCRKPGECRVGRKGFVIPANPSGFGFADLTRPPRTGAANQKQCKTGWWGKTCDKCYPYPGCVHGDCRRPWECNCRPGWGGMLCDQELKYCEDHPGTCENGGSCLSLAEEDGDFRCLCREGFTGRNCELNRNVEAGGGYLNLSVPAAPTVPTIVTPVPNSDLQSSTANSSSSDNATSPPPAAESTSSKPTDAQNSVLK